MDACIFIFVLSKSESVGGFAKGKSWRVCVCVCVCVWQQQLLLPAVVQKSDDSCVMTVCLCVMAIYRAGHPERIMMAFCVSLHVSTQKISTGRRLRWTETEIGRL